MENGKSSQRPGSVSVHDAFYRFTRILAEAESRIEFAPWFDVDPDMVANFGGSDPSGYVRWVKRDHAASRLLTSALIAGELTSHASIEESVVDVPGWAWADFWNDRRTHPMFLLQLRALIPDEWQVWSNARLFLDAEAFEAWVSALDVKAANLPSAMPQPCDASERPAPISYREPPQSPFITLTEALTWIAFHVSLDKDRLTLAMEGNEFGDEAPSRIAQAVKQLAIAASDSQVEVRGRYLNDFLATEVGVDTRRIEPAAFADFAAFHLPHDGLFRGSGFIWDGVDYALEMALGQAASDEYRSVLVGRNDILAQFPPSSAAKSPPMPPLSESDLQAWWNGLDAADHNRSQEELRLMCQVAHPNHHIARNRIRALAPGRKRGPRR